MSQIIIESNGTPYTLEFDRASAMKAEKMYDISYQELSSGKSYVMTALFRSAFIKHHSKMQVSVIDGIWEQLSDKTGLYEALFEMYAQVVNDTMAEPADEGKALSWRKV